MKYHVITPFSRFENMQKISSMLQAQGVATWTLLLRRDEKFDVMSPSGWVRIVRLDVPEGYDVGLVLINRFMMTARFEPEDRYLFLMDDDFYPPDFFACLDRHVEPLIVCSMLRGQRQPPGSKHPCWTLVAAPENMHYGHVGLEQGVFSGAILNEAGAALNNILANNEDMLIGAMSFPTHYAPDIFVWFNYLEPGRWDI